MYKKMVSSGVRSLPITDEKMTRFIITLDEGVNLVINALETTHGGEVIVPKLPSINVVDIVKVFGADLKYHVTGVRPGEKLHEVMIPAEEMRNAVDMGNYYIIQPNHHWWNVSEFKKLVEMTGTPLVGFSEYSSETNPQKMSNEQLKKIIDNI